MKRTIPGLYDGPYVRAEACGRLWSFQVRLRDVGELAGLKTGYSEFHPDGSWTSIGSYRRLKDGLENAERLRQGTHVCRPAHSNAEGSIPARVISYSAAMPDIQERLDVD